MLIDSFFEGDIELAVINDILFDFHRNGPIDQNHLESLAYMKRFQSSFFRKYESRVIFYMGLFYKTGKPKNFIEAVYSSYAEAIREDTGRKFTPTQADAYKAINTYVNFSFSAPTSAGKSYLFQEIIKEVHGDTIIVIPSRALISEYLTKIKNAISPTTLVLPFIEIINTKKSRNRIYVVTPERAEELFKNTNQLNIELILLDEAQLSEEGFRGLKFDSFVRRIERKFPNIKKVFTHPFVVNPEAQFIKHNITNRISAEAYNQKTVGKIYLEHRRKAFKFFSPFDDQIDGKVYDGDFISDIIENNGTVLIYISKSNIYNGSYLQTFSEYIDLCDEIANKEGIAQIARVEEFFGTKDDKEKYSNLIFLMKRGIVIHHGSIPLKARLIIEEFVNGRHARICFSTSTLIQGINMPFDVVWINYFNFMGSEDQKTLNLKNLIGRAGRTSQANSFDFGYVVIESANKNLFTKRLNQDSSLSETSELDNASSTNNEDYVDLVDAVKNDTFNTDLNLTDSQIVRISASDIDTDISFLLDNLFIKNEGVITASDYYSLTDYTRKKIKITFEKVYKVHLRRQELTNGEKGVLSTAIPILLWQIQGKSFAEIVSLRFAYLSDQDFKRLLKKRLKQKEILKSEYESLITARKVKFSCIAHPIPDKNFKNAIPLFSMNTSIDDVDFDKVVYDTYDYIDKVISLSLKDPLVGTLSLYYQRTLDHRSLVLSNYIKYGTNVDKEIWLLRYGFSFDEVEKIISFVEEIDETGIRFHESITAFIKDNPGIDLVLRYL